MSSSEEERDNLRNHLKDNEKNGKRKHSRDHPTANKKQRRVIDDKSFPVYNFFDEMDSVDSDMEDIIYYKYAKKRKGVPLDEREKKYLRRGYLFNESDSEEEELYNNFYEYNPQLVYIFPLLNTEYASFCV